jgi:hypothetical protein
MASARSLLALAAQPTTRREKRELPLFHVSQGDGRSVSARFGVNPTARVLCTHQIALALNVVREPGRALTGSPRGKRC